MASVAIELIYETHSTSEDNERGIATGCMGACRSWSDWTSGVR
ncbi:MAG TPA: hypothetical protein VIK45_09035 [Candidatus Dormibacteraeota bacterium]|jgi:hypothetical protein